MWLCTHQSSINAVNSFLNFLYVLLASEAQQAGFNSKHATDTTYITSVTLSIMGEENPRTEMDSPWKGLVSPLGGSL